MFVGEGVLFGGREGKKQLHFELLEGEEGVGVELEDGSGGGVQGEQAVLEGIVWLHI